jgi:hypothetical protein
VGPEIKLFQPEDRDNWGQYQILSGQTHVFAFTVPINGTVNIGVSHILPNSQDYSLDVWISEEPLDGLVLQNGFGHYKPTRRLREFLINDMFTEMRGDDKMFLIPARTYYVNVKNLQNRVNGYELNIDETAPPPPPPLP